MHDLTAVVSKLYEAAGGIIAWSEAVETLGQGFASCSGILYVETPRHGVELLALPGWSERAQYLYATHYRHADPYAEFARREPRERCILGPEVIAPNAFRKTAIWSEFGRQELPSFHFIGAVLPLENNEAARLACHRQEDARSFEEVDRVRLQQLMPHVKRALQLRQRLVGARRQGILMDWALDRLELGLLVVNPQNVVCYANQAAERLCMAGGLTLGGGHCPSLRAPFHTDNHRLQRLLALVAAGGAGGGLMLRQLDGSRLAALVHPLPASLAAAWLPSSIGGRHEPDPDGTLALVSLRPAGNRLAAHAKDPPLVHKLQLARELFGLTSAEAAVAVALADGSTPLQLARSRDTTVNTVRAQVRQILLKTEASSLRELVSLLTRLF